MEKKYHTLKTVPDCNRKIVVRGTIDTSNIQINERSLTWLGTGSSMNAHLPGLVQAVR